MGKIRVLLADECTVVRQGVRALLAIELDVEVVGEAESGSRTLEMVGNLSPDIVILDFAMSGVTGFELTKQIKRLRPTTKVLILSLSSNEADRQRAIAAGVSGYLVKHSAFDELLEAIRQAQQGKTFFSRSIRKHHAFDPSHERGSEHLNRLSRREMEVLRLIAEGSLNKQIADHLGISIKTVEKHRQQLMNKLAIHNVAGLTRHAIALGIVLGEFANELEAPPRAHP